MEWRIRESGHGGYMAERGIQHAGGVPAPSGMGFTMPAFIVYEAAHFDSQKAAQQYVQRRRQQESE